MIINEEQQEFFDPSTGEKIVIPASKRVAFKTSKTLKDAVRA